MAYISKELVLKSYLTLSSLTEDHKQGQTQIVSAIRHFFALDMYYKEKGVDCDLKIADERNLFVEKVRKLVNIKDEYYTTNFYTTIKPLEDCGVGSNFTSAGVVNNSRQNIRQVYDYPTRGQYPLMNVRNAVLIRNTSNYENIKHYLSSETIRSAFVVWILRDENLIDFSFDTIKNKLLSMFTKELVDSFIPSDDNLLSFIDNQRLQEDNYQIECSDLLGLFKNEVCNTIHSYQQIFYGAPGTGKSHTINEKTEGESVIRTTFHPDSDYSSFVGAYKPTMGLLPICDELGQPMKIGSTVLHKEQIIYEFVDQAFLQAYVQAWKFYAENSDVAKKQYLIIEEINRGNCAQIFGDLFQLLDRNDSGFSVYPINADKDMKKQLTKAFKKDGVTITIPNADKINALYKGKDIVSKVLSGDILVLPNNLYIWATMNTSDQSLFPIDSAFKRRWEWQYMPIGKGYDANRQEIKWAIEGATKKFSWWSFLEKINAQIGEATQSEDKKLGFFFCKATDGTISAEKFVGKVIFYLWNDVFKNNGFEGPIFKDVDGTELTFAKFYKSDMKGNAIVQKEKVELFLTNLGVEEYKVFTPIHDPLPEVDEDGNNAATSTKDFS